MRGDCQRSARRNLRLAVGMTTLASVWGGALAQPAFAQAQVDAGSGDEIVVTATKREERLQNVPISISAISGEALANSGVTRLEELSGTVPNFSVSATPL